MTIPFSLLDHSVGLMAAILFYLLTCLSSKWKLERVSWQRESYAAFSFYDVVHLLFDLARRRGIKIYSIR